MARRPSSVRPSVRLCKSLLLAGKWPDRHQTFTRWTPGQRASRVCSRSRSRSKVTRDWHENRFFSQANGWIATKLAQDGLQVNLHPRCAHGEGQGQRSRDTGNFVLARKSLIFAGKWPDRHQTCTRWSAGKPASRVCSRSRSRSRSKVT